MSIKSRLKAVEDKSGAGKPDLLFLIPALSAVRVAETIITGAQ